MRGAAKRGRMELTGTQALDHEQPRGRSVHRLRDRRSGGWLPRVTAFLVERGFPGFTIGRKEDKLGIRASSTCELLFDDCRVPGANVLGEIGKGYKVAIETLNEGRIGIGAQMVGLAQGALDHAIAYTKERQAVRQADRGVSGGAASAGARGHRHPRGAADGLRSGAAARHGRPFLTEAAMCKLFASEVAERVASLAINLLAGTGS